MVYRAAALVLLCLMSAPIRSAHASPLPAETAGLPSLAPMIAAVTPAVVNIAVVSRVPVQENPLLRDPFFRRFFNIPDAPPRGEERQISAGSGVIIDSARGFVLTNHHVTAPASDIFVTLKDRRRFKARRVGSDPATDIAVLQIDADRLTALPVGNSEDMQVGDYVVAIGNPFGLGQTVTSGIVSALGRSGLNIEGYEDFIQTDASINPGNSGGALIDTAGNLVGINSTIFSQTGGSLGIGFSIPVSLARNVFEQIARDGEVTRGWLGIEPAAVTAEVAKALALQKSEGVVIRSVQPGGPAERAGMKQLDVVLEIGGKSTRNVPQLLARIAELPPGSTAKIKIVRAGHDVEVDVMVGKRPPPERQ